MCTKIIPITGIYGAGKSSVIGGLLGLAGDRFICPPSICTRPPRHSDLDSAKKYVKVDPELFRVMADQDFFLENELVNDEYYGTPLIFFQAAKKLGRDLVLDIDVKGAMRLIDKRDEGEKHLKDVQILPVFLWRNISPDDFDESRDRQKIFEQIKKSFEKRKDSFSEKDLLTRTETAIGEYKAVIQHPEIFTKIENVENSLPSTIELFEKLFF
ncbi:MAG: hypothetical protein WCO35_02685 [Candidatus Nomurabacteria bacterium]